MRKKANDFGFQQVEAKLHNAEIEDEMSASGLEEMQEKVQQAAKLLEAQGLYLQSLDLKVRSTASVIHRSGKLVYNNLAPSDSLTRAFDDIGWDPTSLIEQLRELQHAVFAATDSPEQLYQLLESYRERQRDLQAATNKFSHYLKSPSHISSKQLRQFESQYDKIRGAYDRARLCLLTELSKLEDKQLKMVELCFSKLIPIEKKLLQHDQQFLVLSQGMCKSLQDTSKREADHHTCEESHPKSQSQKLFTRGEK